ncbi:class I adenylate-forming enzyme family protein [Nocardioides cheoyonin]|uniref:class I adenylate-forming enzyme family protein n=1 Tax=Nocardioides cheoyonin TaxID=3156615 RepID=UPI0032B4619D
MTESTVERRRERLETGLGAGWTPTTLAGRFDAAVGRFPDRPYLLVGTQAWTYAELQEWSRAVARGLYEVGVRSGDPVAMVVDNRPEFVAVKLAIARLGATAVPINFGYRADELATVLNTSRAEVLVTIDAVIGVDHLASLDEICPGWEAGADLASATVPHLRRVVLVGTGARPGALDLAGLVELGRHAGEGTVRALEDGIDPDSPCDVVFTSGTSGHPLGAVLTHDMVLRSGYGSAYHRGFDDGWRIAFSLPMYHVFGYVEGMVAAMYAGGAIAPHAVFNPRSMLTTIQQHNIHEVLFVPTMSIAVVEEAMRRDYDTASLESVFSAAAAAPVRLWQQIEKVLGPRQVFTGYGQTEVSAATALTLPGDPLEVVSATVGRMKLGGSAALPGMDGALAAYRTVDPFTGAVLPEGTEGELSVRGPIVTREYFGDPERTAAMIDAEGWLRTGDLGRVRADGYLELSGRSGELFKVGGELVAPTEVEHVITAHPAVEQAYVAGMPDARLGEVGWAWVVRAEEASVDEDELVRHCRRHLAGFKVPRRMLFVSAENLPKTTTGKIQKYRLVGDASD